MAMALLFAVLVLGLVANQVACPKSPAWCRVSQMFLGYSREALEGRGSFVGPFVMASVNASVVRRSNAINQCQSPPPLGANADSRPRLGSRHAGLRGSGC